MKSKKEAEDGKNKWTGVELEKEEKCRQMKNKRKVRKIRKYQQEKRNLKKMGTIKS